MDKSYYLSLLGLKPSATIEEIRKAYRVMARRFHPDLNSSPGAADRFIEVTEAYEYLTQHFNVADHGKAGRDELYEEWVKFRKEQARERARRYAQVRYKQFKTSGYYKTSSSADVSRIIYNLVISLFIIFAAVYGYIYRLRMVSEGFEKPTIGGFISLLVVGSLFLTVSVLYLVAFYQVKNERKKIRYEKNKKSI